VGQHTFALGLVGVMIGITYGIQPYGGHTMGWTSPFVLAMLLGGTALLIAFCVIEAHVDDPMFHIDLFRIRAFARATSRRCSRDGSRRPAVHPDHLAAGIWLPEHGYAFDRTPLWAGIYMLPLIAGFLVAGPASGWLSDRSARARSRPAGCCSRRSASRSSHFGDFGQAELRPEQRKAIGDLDALLLPVGAGPTVGASQPRRSCAR
jgi:MFS family permease